jgi:hypothetical protein
MAYTNAQILAQLQAPQRTWDFEYKIFDISGAYRGDINVESCSIANNDLADIKRTANLSIAEVDAAAINFASDRIQPLIKLRMPDAGWQIWPMGMFLMASPTQVHAGLEVVPRAITAYDLGIILREDLVTGAYTVLAGTKYTDAINAVLFSAGLPAASISPSPSLLTATKEWDPGTSKYVIVNDLLNGINYASLSFDGNGIPVAIPYLDPASAPSIYNYAIGVNGVVVPDNGISETLDLSSVSNVFVLYVNSPDTDPTGAPITLISTYTNSNPSSPTSTVSLGRNIVSYQEVTDIADQATLDAAAKAAAQSASQVYSQVEFTSGMMPIHTTADVMTVDWGSGTAPKYRETEWDLDLVAGGLMTHKVRKVVSV